MKRTSVFLSLALIVVMVFSFAGCTVALKDKGDKAPSDDKGNYSYGDFEAEAKITRDEAKEKALNHAGVTESEVYDLEISLDRENGVLVYEVDFKKDRTEYTYDIDAKSGEILKSYSEPDD